MKSVDLTDKNVMSDDRIFTRNYMFGFLANLSFFIAANYLIPIFPLYLKELGFDNTRIGLVISAYSLSAIFLRPVVGQLYSTYGTKRLMLGGAILFILAHPLYVLTSFIPLLLVIRVIHGAGMANFATASSIFVVEVSPAKRLAQAIGIYTTSASLAMGLAPALGTYLVGKLSYETLLLVPSLIGLITVAAVWKIGKLPLPKDLNQVKSFREVFKDRNVLIPGLTWVSCSFTLSVVTAFLPLYVLTLKNVSAAYFFGAYSITLILIRLIGGGLSDRYGRIKIIIPSIFSIFIGALGMSQINSTIALVLCAVAFGIGFGLAYPSMSAMVVDHAGTANRGMALGIFSASVDLGFFLGPLTMGFVSNELGYSLMYALTSVIPLLGLAFFAYYYGYRMRQRSRSKIIAAEE